MITNIAAYHFTPIDAPEAFASTLRARAEALSLRGSVLVAGEGLNLFLAGDAGAIASFLAPLREDARFAGLRVKYSTSRQVPFARLKVKVKPEIISFRRPGTTPEHARAPAVEPATLARWLEQGHDDAGRRVVMLDTRNQQEIAYGTFAGALTLPIDKFTDLPAALEPHRQALKDATVASAARRPRCGCRPTAWTTCCSSTTASSAISSRSAASATKAPASCSTNVWPCVRT